MAQSLVARGVIADWHWQSMAYPQGDDVCLTGEGGASCLSLRADRQIEEASTSPTGSGRWVVVGIARPAVATVRYALGDQTVDIPTVPLSFRSDVRAFAYAAQSGDFAPLIVAILDAQGALLPDPLLP